MPKAGTQTPRIKKGWKLCVVCGHIRYPYAYYPLFVNKEGKSEGMHICKNCIDDFHFDKAGNLVSQRSGQVIRVDEWRSYKARRKARRKSSLVR